MAISTKHHVVIRVNLDKPLSYSRTQKLVLKSLQDAEKKFICADGFEVHATFSIAEPRK